MSTGLIVNAVILPMSVAVDDDDIVVGAEITKFISFVRPVFVGVIVFCGMLLISMVMPLVFLSAVQNQAKNEYAAFRALADPFMDDQLGDSDRELLERGSDYYTEQGERVTAEPVHVAVTDTKGEIVIAAQRRSRASLYYVIAIVLMVLLNGALAAANRTVE